MLAGLTAAFGKTLTQTEWLSPEKLRLYQQPLVARLLSHARTHTDFYRDRLDFDLTSPEAVEAAWAAIPILTRAEAIANRERLIARAVPPDVGATQDGTTSGATGRPFTFLRSEISLLASQALNERMMRWWKVDGRKPLARIAFEKGIAALPPDGATLSGWHSAHPAAPQYVLSTIADVATQLRWLATRKPAPAYLAAYGHLLKALALESRQTGTALRFDLLFSFGLVVDDEARSLCRDVFKAEIADGYGTEEAGHLASQCPQCGEYHIGAEAARVEILRDDGTPAAPGEIGRVIVTPFYNYAMPLIRYEIGDLAEAGAARPRCRRGLPAIRCILGRYRNVFRYADGTVRSPSPERFGLRDFIRYRQCQVIQTALDRIEVRWTGDDDAPPVDAAALTENIRSVLGFAIEVSVVKVEAIERSPSGKFEDFISLVP